MRARGAWVVRLAIGLLLAACNDSEQAHPGEPLAAVVPRDAFAYAEATIRLSGEQGDAARSFARSLTGGERVAEGALIDLLTGAAGADIDFERDLASWLGDRGAVFALDRGGRGLGIGVALATTDDKRAAAFLRRRLGSAHEAAMHHGVRLWHAPGGRAAAIVAGHAVFGNSIAALHAAIDARRAPLSSAARFRRLAGPGTQPFAVRAETSTRASTSRASRRGSR